MLVLFNNQLGKKIYVLKYQTTTLMLVLFVVNTDISDNNINVGSGYESKPTLCYKYRYNRKQNKTSLLFIEAKK